MLDPSNAALTAAAIGLGCVGAVIVEKLWWLRGATTGTQRRIWKHNAVHAD